MSDDFVYDVTKFSIFTDVLEFKPWIDQITNDQTNLTCTTHSHQWNDLLGNKFEVLLTCSINDQKINGEGFSVAGDPTQNLKAFSIANNKEVEFLRENFFKTFPGLVAYRAQNCLITTVNGQHFKDLIKLEYLDLSINKIESIEGDSFKDLTKFERLNLKNNKIKKIDPNWFQSLQNLSRLFISENQIEMLDEQVFDNLKNLGIIAVRY